MSSRPELKLDWCSHEAAKYAVEHWHYSHNMPVGKMVKVGVWEGGAFIGAVVFSQGNNQYQGTALGLTTDEVCELTRVALTAHVTPVTRVVAIALKMLHKAAPGLRLVVSYADPEQGHVGAIYQAGGWTFVGTGGSAEAFYDKRGNRIHSRRISPTGQKNLFGKMVACPTPDELVKVPLRPKWKYLMPLDETMRKQIEPLRKPYPKRAPVEGDEVTTSERRGSSDPHAPIPSSPES